jgi:hypothetical protein
MKINAAARLLAYDKTWIKRMNQYRQAHPKYQGQQKPTELTDEHIFTLDPSALAQRLKTLYKDDFKSAMQALTMYKNRAGKTLLSPDRDRLDKAKEQLRKLYGKDDEDKSKPKNTGPQSPNKGKSTNERRVGDEPIGSRPTTKTV